MFKTWQPGRHIDGSYSERWPGWRLLRPELTSHHRTAERFGAHEVGPTDPGKEEIEISMKLTVRNSRVAAALTLAAGMVAAGLLAGSAGSAGADPYTSPVANPLVAVGSNTIQDMLDAFSGAAPTPNNAGNGTAGNHQATVYYTPLHDPAVGTAGSPLASGSFTQIESYSAVNPNTFAEGECIATKPGGNSYARPNGSGDGMKALSDEIQNPAVSWSKTTGGCPATTIAGGQIDISRSSKAPTAASGTQLTWIRFARDAISYAYMPNANVTQTELNNVTTDLNLSELSTAYSTPLGSTTQPPLVVDGVTIMPAWMQTGSGTESTWLGDLTPAVANTSGTTVSPAAATGLEENGANADAAVLPGAMSTFLTDNSLPSTTPVLAVIGFSVGSWVSQANGVALDRSSTGRTQPANSCPLLTSTECNMDLGTLGLGFGKPYTGTPGSEVGVTAFYATSGVGGVGRDLYVIVPFANLNLKATASAAERSLFGFFTNLGTAGTANEQDATTVEGEICNTTTGPMYGANLIQPFGFLPLGDFAGEQCGQETNTVLVTGTGS
jgi:hypothetical protein